MNLCSCGHSGRSHTADPHIYDIYDNVEKGEVCFWSYNCDCKGWNPSNNIQEQLNNLRKEIEILKQGD